MLFFFNGFDYNEFRKISTYESAKRKKNDLRTLKITNERTNIIKVSKLNKLVTIFENLIMSSDEFFEIFILSFIVLLVLPLILGKRCQKIFKSLPKRFKPKVTRM